MTSHRVVSRFFQRNSNGFEVIRVATETEALYEEVSSLGQFEARTVIAKNSGIAVLPHQGKGLRKPPDSANSIRNVQVLTLAPPCPECLKI